MNADIEGQHSIKLSYLLSSTASAKLLTPCEVLQLPLDQEHLYRQRFMPRCRKNLKNPIFSAHLTIFIDTTESESRKPIKMML